MNDITLSIDGKEILIQPIVSSQVKHQVPLAEERIGTVIEHLISECVSSHSTAVVGQTIGGPQHIKSLLRVLQITLLNTCFTEDDH